MRKLDQKRRKLSRQYAIEGSIDAYDRDLIDVTEPPDPKAVLVLKGEAA